MNASPFNRFCMRFSSAIGHGGWLKTGNAQRVFGLICCFFLFAAPQVAHAEVRTARADGFTIVHAADVSTAPDATYAALGRIGRWWNGAHTYSGDPNRLRLRLEARGCFCERWVGGSVEHGRVILAMPGKSLRLDAPLGPLQGMGVQAVLTFAITPAAGGSHLEMTYEAVGRDDQALDRLAPIVDQVLGEQFGRLNRYLATGSPT